MNLKLRLYKARSNNIPFYFLVLIVCYVGYLTVKRFSPPTPEDRIPKHLRKYLRFNEKHTIDAELTEEEVNRLNAKVEKWNMERVILNWKPYAPMKMDATIFAIQVHKDAERLQYLIVSLAQVKHIEDALLIFSHSYYDEEINSLVRNITFCRVMQLFYPYSLQLHPNKFPGTDPEDCGNKNSLDSRKSCTKRDPRITEHKQHWWWKANLIFDHVEWSYKYKGIVIFLEEDDYVLSDTLHMLNYAKHSLSYIPDIEVISFGRPYSEVMDYDLLTVDAWRPPFDRGLAFNKTTWNRILALSSEFCMFDDFSWSYSLLHLFTRLRRGRVNMIACMAPRVLSTAMFRSGMKAMETISWRLERAKLYPESVKAVMLYSQSGRVDRELKAQAKGNGGWNDIRDHLLCLDPLMSTVTETEDDSTTTSSLFK